MHGVGLIHGNVVRPLCFDMGEQRYERHIIKIKVSARNIGYGDQLTYLSEPWGEHTHPYLHTHQNTHILLNVCSTNTHIERTGIIPPRGGSGQADPQLV